MLRRNSILLFLLIFCVYTNTNAQKITPEGAFIQDSTKVGEVIAYTLSIRYPRSESIIFPDSTYDFSPFELVRKEAFSTKSDSLNSFDSTVYYLSTFETEHKQVLALPVYLIKNTDSISLFANEDEITLVTVLGKMPDSLAVLENTNLQPVVQEFNYPYLIAGLILLAIILIAIALIFGKRIRQKIRVYRLKKAYQSFLGRYDKALSSLTSTDKSQESLLLIWKKYMEKLEGIPYTKFTSKEIVKLHPQENLKIALSEIDRNIYGGFGDADIKSKFGALRNYSEERLNVKLEEVQNA